MFKCNNLTWGLWWLTSFQSQLIIIYRTANCHETFKCIILPLYQFKNKGLWNPRSGKGVYETTKEWGKNLHTKQTKKHPISTQHHFQMTISSLLKDESFFFFRGRNNINIIQVKLICILEYTISNNHREKSSIHHTREPVKTNGTSWHSKM